MAIGVDHAGVKTIWANDFDKRVCNIYSHNFPDTKVVCSDINDVDIQSIPNADIVIGGPPCQDYSVGGMQAGEDGEKGKQVWTYLEIIRQKQPKAFLFENVKGLIQKHKHTFEKLIKQFDEIGYNISWKLVNAWNYGVAQTRERVFIVGIRKDIGKQYDFPDEVSYFPTLSDAFVGLTNNTPNYDPKPLSEAGRAYIERDSRHITKHRPVDLDEPSRTITANLYKGVPHGMIFPYHRNEYNATDLTKLRLLTVRECLRIQSVPDTYTFPAKSSKTAQFTVIGNGVPSIIAYLLTKKLLEILA